MGVSFLAKTAKHQSNARLIGEKLRDDAVVVVVEPTDNYRSTLRRYLQNLKISNARFYVSVAEARADLGTEHVGLVICEWKDKAQNGLQFCREIREGNSNREVPFLLLSVESLARDVVLASEVGIDGYLLKPFSFEEFAEQIPQVFRKADLRVRFSDLIFKAETMLEEGQLGAAERLLTECRDYEEGSARALCGLGRIRLKEKKMDEAFSYFDESIKVNGQYIEAYRQIIALCESRNDPHLTLHYALRAHELSPDNPRYVLMIAKSYLEIREYDKSEQFFRKVLRLSPKLAEAYKGLGDVALAREDYDEAMKSYQKALDLDGQDVGILNAMGLVFIKQGHYLDGIKRYQLALGIDQNNAKVLFNLGFAFEKIDDFQNAMHYYNLALIAEPDFEKPRRGLARLQALSFKAS